MNERFELLLDCDGVLANFHDAALDVIRSVLGHVPEKCLRSPNVFGELEPFAEQACWNQVNAEGWVGSLEAYTGATQAVWALQEICDVIIVSAPLQGEYWHHERLRWLADHFGIHARDVVLTSRKHQIRGDMLVDDRAKIVRAWHDRNPGGLGYVWKPGCVTVEPDMTYLLDWKDLHASVVREIEVRRRMQSRDEV